MPVAVPPAEAGSEVEAFLIRLVGQRFAQWCLFVQQLVDVFVH